MAEYNNRAVKLLYLAKALYFDKNVKHLFCVSKTRLTDIALLFILIFESQNIVVSSASTLISIIKEY